MRADADPFPWCLAVQELIPAAAFFVVFVSKVPAPRPRPLRLRLPSRPLERAAAVAPPCAACVGAFLQSRPAVYAGGLNPHAPAQDAHARVLMPIVGEEVARRWWRCSWRHGRRSLTRLR